MKDLEKLRSSVSYDPETGLFKSLINSSKWRVGKIIGYPIQHGYVSFSIGGRHYLAHRMAFYLMTGSCPKTVDHINGDCSDNRWANLRECTSSQNGGNARRRKNHPTGFKGVTNRMSGRFQARITVAGDRITLGVFDSAEMAHEAYMAAAKQHFGEFSRSH